MTEYQSIEAKREEFRKYLEAAGVMDALTKVFIALYEAPEKPEDPLEFVRNNIGENVPDVAEFEKLQAELSHNLALMEQIKGENEALKQRLQELGEEGDAPPADAPAEDAPAEEAPPAEEGGEAPAEEAPAEEAPAE